MAEASLFDGCLMFVLYVPDDATEAVPQRQSLIGAITAYGGTLISRREVIQVQFADKVTVLAVNRHALPRKLPLLPGTCVYDGSWVFDSINAGAMLPLEDYELLDGPAGLPEKQASRNKAAPQEQRAAAAAPPQEIEEAPVDAAAPGVEAEEREDGEAPKRKRFTAEEDEKLRGWVADHPDIKVKGNKLWEKAEREKLLPGRTYQAMRERFTKHLLGGGGAASPTNVRRERAVRPASPLVEKDDGKGKPGSARKSIGGTQPQSRGEAMPLAERPRSTKRALNTEQAVDPASAEDDMMVDSGAIRKRLRLTATRMQCRVEDVLHALMVTSGLWAAAEEYLDIGPEAQNLAKARSWCAGTDEALKVLAGARVKGKETADARQLLRSFSPQEVHDRCRFLGLLPLRS